MKRIQRKVMRKIKRQHKRYPSFLEALRLYDGMPALV